MVINDVRPTREERERFEQARRQKREDEIFIAKIKRDIDEGEYWQTHAGRLYEATLVLSGIAMMMLFAAWLEVAKGATESADMFFMASQSILILVLPILVYLWWSRDQYRFADKLAMTAMGAGGAGVIDLILNHWIG